MSERPPPMRLLLSAYACEPGRGSEPAVGWNWALALAARGHEVWVLTRENNRGPIEEAMAEHPHATRLHFVYHDLSPSVRRWKRGGRGVHLYYLLWQWTAARRARELHRIVGFDKVHHVTFVSLRIPSFMGGLGIPFTYGPVAGGEVGPWNLWRRLPLGEALSEGLRALANAWLRFDPLAKLPLRRAEKIWVTSAQTLAIVPAALRTKAAVTLAIALSQQELDAAAQRPRPPKSTPGLRCLYVGRFIGWKGMHLGLQAFARLRQIDPDATLTLVGAGPSEAAWRSQAHGLGVADALRWLAWLPRGEVVQQYLQSDVLLFPSLHDSGGMVVLEAMCHGTVPVCLALGGPGVIVTAGCGFPVDTMGCSEEQVVVALTQALAALTESVARQRISSAARDRARFFTYDRLVERVYGTALGAQGGDR